MKTGYEMGEINEPEYRSYEWYKKHLKGKFSIGILSWGAPRTLRNTLNSYVESGLFDLTDDIIIFFQEVSETDIAIAQEFNIPYIIQSSSNIGIGKAFYQLVKSAKYDRILLLEQDWVVLPENFSIVAREIFKANSYLSYAETWSVDIIKMRSREYPGEPLYTRQFRDREMDCPQHLLECVHWRENPHLDFPDKIGYRTDHEGGKFNYSKIEYCSYTNNPCFVKKDLWLKYIGPFAENSTGISLEGDILSYWNFDYFGTKIYNVGHGDGLFTHQRLDR